MLETTQTPSLSPSISPARAIELWPANVPLAALVSDVSHAIPGQRFSYLAPTHHRITPGDWLDGQTGDRPGNWPALIIPALCYELGGRIEPRAEGRSTSPWESGEVLLCDAAYRFDHHLGAWTVLGNPELLPPIPESAGSSNPAWSLGPLRSDIGRLGYEARVARAIEYIRAGDIFQVNLAHRLCAEFSGSARSLFGELLAAARPAYGAYIEASPGTILSLSPELFLAYDASSRSCLTRPMKGTASAQVGKASLESSQKDRAELRMIVDLMRNDISRVCDIGTVQVDESRAIETHAGGGVHQGVATISGTLRKDKSLQSLIRASFPAGSITGAPKVRAMQIIDELEQTARGPYCGTIGAIDAQGNAVFNVGIRTAMITGDSALAPGTYKSAQLVYPVGAGIVADSKPELEWDETLAKASIWAKLSEPSEPSA